MGNPNNFGMGKVRFTVLGMVLVGFLGMAQNVDRAKLDQYFDVLEEHNRFMGSVAVSQNGELIYSRALGYADVDAQIKADTEIKYRIGSISKIFTAVLVLKAVEAKLLDLDQRLGEFFPEVPNADEISLTQLLSHRSGIHNFTDDPQYLTYNTQAKTREELISIIVGGGSDFEPDARMAYSNSNYVLLTFILEMVHDKPFARILEEEITVPLGLENTYMGGRMDPGNKESRSYRFLTHWTLEPETDLSIPLGAGGVVSNPMDLVKFSDALFGGKLLKSERMELMKTLRDNFGLGLFHIPFYDRAGYGHTGGIDGFTSVLSHFADGAVSYALLSNGTNFNNNAISIAVLSAVFDKPYELPNFGDFEVDPELLERYVGVYSSDRIPMKLTISTDKGTLIAQGSGQPSFALEASERNRFEYDPAGVVIEFIPEENTLILKQFGSEFLFKKE